jgi:regulator of protease activity HflC (stomatin/prohibitin superfamily)
VVEQYQLGMSIDLVQLKNINPPKQVQASFNDVVEKSAPKLKDFGVELIDVWFMQVNYNPGVSAKIHERMMSERQQIASRFRSEGEGEAAKILGSKERDLRSRLLFEPIACPESRWNRPMKSDNVVEICA